MTDPTSETLEGILRKIAEAAPGAWFPSEYATAHGIARESLDPFLDDLRMAGLAFCDYEQGRGQGYKLTEAGQEVVANSRQLAQLRRGQLPAPQEVLPARTGAASDFERGEDIRERFQNPIDAVVSRYLLIANILVFVVGIYLATQIGVPVDQYLSGRGEGMGRVFQAQGGLRGDRIVDGQWWRMLTTCFVHAGIMHLGMNMFALTMFGPMCERLWGHLRFLILYLLAGFGGSCATLILSPPYIWVVGASGAICGLLGAFGIWVLLNRRFLGQLGQVWLRNVMMNVFIIAIVSSLPGISASAHFGGAFAGALVAALLQLERYGSRVQRAVALLGMLALPVLGVVLVQRVMYTSHAWMPFTFPAVSEPTEAALLDLASVISDDVKPVVALGPARRAAVQVESARIKLEAACAAVAAEQQRWQRGHFFMSGELAEARELVLDCLASATKVCELARTDLEGGPDWRQADRALESQLADMQQKQDKWVRFVNAAMR